MVEFGIYRGDARLQAQGAIDQSDEGRWQFFPFRTDIADRQRIKADLAFLGQELVTRHFALVCRALQQQPGRKLHQPRGQPHRLGAVDHHRRLGHGLGFRATFAIKIVGAFFDKLHAASEKLIEAIRESQVLRQANRVSAHAVSIPLPHWSGFLSLAGDRVKHLCGLLLRSEDRRQDKKRAARSGSEELTGRRQSGWIKKPPGMNPESPDKFINAP